MGFLLEPFRVTMNIPSLARLQVVPAGNRYVRPVARGNGVLLTCPHS